MVLDRYGTSACKPGFALFAEHRKDLKHFLWIGDAERCRRFPDANLDRQIGARVQGLEHVLVRHIVADEEGGGRIPIRAQLGHRRAFVSLHHGEFENLFASSDVDCLVIIKSSVQLGKNRQRIRP